MKHTILAVLLLLFKFNLSFSQSTISLEDRDFHPTIEPDTSLTNWLNSFAEYRNLSQEDQNAVYWVDYVRKQPKLFCTTMLNSFLNTFKEIDLADAKSLKSELMSAPSLKLVRPSSVLIKTATSHALDIGQNGKNISHSSTQGKSFGDRMREAGIQKCAFENIYSGKNDGLEAIILLLIDAGVPGKGHRKAILNPEITSIGVSFEKFKAQNNFILVQDFSCD